MLGEKMKTKQKHCIIVALEKLGGKVNDYTVLEYLKNRVVGFDLYGDMAWLVSKSKPGLVAIGYEKL